MPSGARTMDEETAPKVIVKKIEGKMETLERHVPQMLLRGEQVAIIVKINWDSEYVLPPRNGHCDVTSRDIMLRRIESSRATLYLHQLYLFFFSFSPPPFCIVFFRAVLSNKRLRCFSLWFITRSWRVIMIHQKKEKMARKFETTLSG